MKDIVTINGLKVPFEGEKNLLDLCRKANIDIPTFCYHSELSVYGACRLCLVDIDGMGLVTSCSTVPKPGMVIKTNTETIRSTRKTIVKLLLANHDNKCTTCYKSGDCRLRDLADRMGIDEVKFTPTKKPQPIDDKSSCLVRDPNKCILCGDCVRYCSEIQNIGVIDFVGRGDEVVVSPAFNKSLADVDCINCGQCAAVCPTGAIVPKSEVQQVWKALDSKDKLVVAQIAPAVRVAIGELFGSKDSTAVTGKIFRALRLLGFNRVYDTSFGADLTVIEEANEFLARLQSKEKLPLFTSCCPGWVKYAEQSYPDLLENLSSCMSPQQMQGSIVKHAISTEELLPEKDIVMVSIMPCTAKKYENKRPEHTRNGVRLVDYVLTTQELAKMIKEAGIVFDELVPDSADMPFGFATGAGVIFGNSGGVSEAVLRYAYEQVTGSILTDVEFTDVRGNEGIKEATINIAGTEVRMAIVHGIRNAGIVAEKCRAGENNYDIIEVMACPGGCIGGAGQPVVHESSTRAKRTHELYNVDRRMQLHKSQQNPFITDCYNKYLDGKPGSHNAHELLHTHYHAKRRINEDPVSLVNGSGKEKVQVKVCIGTSCFLKGSQEILSSLIKKVESAGNLGYVDISATFCKEKCDVGPTVRVGDDVVTHATTSMVMDKLNEHISAIKAGE
jgi:NADH-quinone oxidoreductase subunit G